VKNFASVEYFDASRLALISSWSDNCFACLQQEIKTNTKHFTCTIYRIWRKNVSGLLWGFCNS